MKKSRFSEEQMVAILREADKAPVRGAAACRHSAPAPARSREREAQETRCRARSRDRDNEGDQSPKVVSSQARRERVALARERGHSRRRACEPMGIARSGLGYESVRAERDRPTLEAMRRLAAQYPRYGYRRIRVFLRREGHSMSRQRAHRLWRVAGLQLPRRRPRRRVATSRPRPLPATGPNHVWAYDFVFDACANGQQLRCLTVIDEFTRECLAIDVAGSIRSGRVIEALARLISERGAPRYLRSDNGPEFVSHAILEWLAKEKIETALIDPGKPWQNGDNESFNGKFRDECLSLEWFRSRAEAKIVIETWRRHYNHIRPHQSLKDLTPIEFKTRYDAVNQGAVLQS
jgi:putative transposase